MAQPSCWLGVCTLYVKNGEVEVEEDEEWVGVICEEVGLVRMG